jgi:hypothetical protein
MDNDLSQFSQVYNLKHSFNIHLNKKFPSTRFPISGTLPPIFSIKMLYVFLIFSRVLHVSPSSSHVDENSKNS